MQSYMDRQYRETHGCKAESCNWAIKQCNSPSRFSSMDRATAYEPKGPGFNSSQGHVPQLQAQSLSPVGHT